MWVGLGEMIGANARYALTKRWSLGMNCCVGNVRHQHGGAFLIGLLLTLLTERSVGDPTMRLVLMVGFLGGYTTPRLRSYIRGNCHGRTRELVQRVNLCAPEAMVWGWWPAWRNRPGAAAARLRPAYM